MPPKKRKKREITDAQRVAFGANGKGKGGGPPIPKALNVVFVGEAPSRNGNPDDPLGMGPGSGARLADLMGMEQVSFCQRFARFNLNRHHSSMFDVSEAKYNAQAIIWAGMRRGDIAVLLGRKVAAVFGLNLAPWFTWHEKGGRNLLVMPHPSGKNLWWNDEDNQQQARRVLSTLHKEWAKHRRISQKLLKSTTDLDWHLDTEIDADYPGDIRSPAT